MNREVLMRLIAEHEGKKYKVYLDSEGFKTVGIGYNLDDETARGPVEALKLNFDDVCAGNCELAEHHVQTLFDHKLNIAATDAVVAIDNFWDHPDDVQHAVIDMLFNMGRPRFLGFRKFIGALEKNPPDYKTAAAEMMASRWAEQVPNRAKDDQQLILNHV